MTQLQLGKAIGFSDGSADARIGQYECGSRKPKAELTERMAEVLDVAPMTLMDPDIDSYEGLMHTLFALEDLYGLHVVDIYGKPHLCGDIAHIQFHALNDLLNEWKEQYLKLQAGAISREEYDRWRYNYPEGMRRYHERNSI